jgi:hypothetical protein
VLFAVAAVLFTYWPLLAGRIVFLRDTALWVLPARWFVRQSLLAGEFPSWNPYQGLGFPVLADPQYGLFYPPNWLYLLAPESVVAHLASWMSLLHLAWGGLGMVLLARRMGVEPFGAAVAGVCWSLSGHVTSAWSVGQLLLADAWIPWVARGFLLLARREGRWPLLSAVWPLAMSLLLGEVFVSAMAMIFAAVVVSGAGVPRAEIRTVVAVGARAAAAWLVAMLIAAPSWLPPLQMLGATERAQAFSRESAELFSHHPFRLIEMITPGALGDPTGAFPAGQWIGESAAGGAPLFFSSYLGVIAVALMVLSLRRERLRLVLIAWAGLALFIAFGKFAPVHEVWRRILFPFAHMHSPEKYVVLVVAPVSLLAGFGAARLMMLERRDFRRVAYAAGILVMWSVAAGSILPPVLVRDVRSAAFRGLALLGLCLMAALAARRWPRLCRSLLLLLVASDLGIPANHLAGFGSARTLASLPGTAAAVLRDSRPNPAPPRIFREPDVEEYAPGVATWKESQERAVVTLTPNTLNLFGLASVPGYDSAIPDQLARIGPTSYAELVDSLRLLSVQYAMLSDGAIAQAGQAAFSAALSRPLPGVTLARVQGALPRVYLPAHVRAVAAGELPLAMRNPAVAAGREAMLSTQQQVVAMDAGDTHPCTIVGFFNTRVVATCSARTPNYAIFVEQFDRGWTATVDGLPAPVVTANLVMRAVPVPAGEHTVELRYHAPRLPLVIMLSFVGCAIAFAVAARSRTRRTTSSPRPGSC